MKKVKFKDLRIKLREKYILRDNLGCDHILIFLDVIMGKSNNTENMKENIYWLF